MAHYKITVQYDGTRYDGWQKQVTTENTIQGKLETILKKMSGKEIEVRGSGRTDSGVHALGQIADFFVEDEYSEMEVQDYLNRYLPEDIAVTEIEAVPERFHSRLNATCKTYTYYIETGKKKPVFQRKYSYHLGKSLDISAMKSAALLLCGRHDFKSFCSNKRMKKSAVRTMMEIKIEQRGSQVIVCYKATGFLQQMVRILTGTLIEVGLGQRKADSMKELLEVGIREKAGYTVPSEGLFLTLVEYE